MLLKLNKYSYLIFAICFFTAAGIIENGLLNKHPEIHLIKDFQEQLLTQENELNKQVEKIAGIVSNENFDGSYFEVLKNNTRLLEETGFAYLVYRKGFLLYWSDRSVSFYNSIREFKKTDGLIQLPNGFYLARHKVAGENEIIGLHLIKYNYEHQNKYLKNEFFNTYELPDQFQLIEKEHKSLYPVVDSNGEFLFSINAGGQFLCTENQLYLPGAIYLLGLIILLFYFRREFLES